MCQFSNENNYALDVLIYTLPKCSKLISYVTRHISSCYISFISQAKSRVHLAIIIVIFVILSQWIKLVIRCESETTKFRLNSPEQIFKYFIYSKYVQSLADQENLIRLILTIHMLFLVNIFLTSSDISRRNRWGISDLKQTVNCIRKHKCSSRLCEFSPRRSSKSVVPVRAPKGRSARIPWKSGIVLAWHGNNGIMRFSYNIVLFVNKLLTKNLLNIGSPIKSLFLYLGSKHYIKNYFCRWGKAIIKTRIILSWHYVAVIVAIAP